VEAVDWGAELPSMNRTPNIALRNNIRESGFAWIGMLVLDMAYPLSTVARLIVLSVFDIL
jgi:hypothetical protein